MSGLPEGWAKIRLADAMAAGAPIIYGILQPGPHIEDGVPYVRPSEINEGVIEVANLRRTSLVISERYARATLECGDVILSIVGTIGKVAIVPLELNGANITQSSCRLRSDPLLLLSSFLSEFLTSADAREQFSSKRLGTGVPRLNLQDVRDFLMPLPPVAEQHRIVAKIDRLFARSKRARDELDQSLLQCALAKTLLLNQMFSTLDEHAIAFSDILDIKGGSQPPKSTFSTQHRPRLVRLLQIRDFTSDDKAVYIADEPRWSRCCEDDILLGRYGASVGRVLTGKAGAYNVALVKMIFDKKRVEPRFLYWWLQTEAFQGHLRLLSRSAQNGFNKEDLKNIRFPIPDHRSQETIVRRIEHAFAAIDRLAAEARSARALLDTLDQAILAKAFRGELVPQNPNDEPASVLLKRIRAERAAAPPKPRGRCKA